MSFVKIQFVLFSFLFVNTKCLPVYPLQDTGQKTGTATMFGEDKDYEINPLYFIDNKDGTVTDYVTKLMWEQSETGEIGWDSSVQYCNQLRAGGYSDWRLPDVHELYGIVNIGTPLFNIPPFYVPYPPAPSQAQYHWSSTAGRDLTYRWAINAGGGAGDKPISVALSAGGTDSFRAKCVRTAAPFYTAEIRYTVFNNGLIAQDNTNGLVWQLQEPGMMTWLEGISYCENLVYSGFNDWRLPDVKELFTTCDTNRFSPAIDSSVFTRVDAKAEFWTSSTEAKHPIENAWIVQYRTGITTYAAKNSALNVRCVRGGYIAN